jgi:hypothetical protein
MTEPIRSWFKENQTLVLFLIAQALAIGTVGVSIIAYMVRLETRVSTMETRGAAYTADRLNRIDGRLTVLEESTRQNTERLDRIVTIMTGGLKRGSP